MSYRFNSFYTDTMHPFVEAMNFIFADNTSKLTRPAFVRGLMIQTNARVAEYRKVLRATGKSIIDNRKANPSDKNDMLNTMIHGKDPKTGEVMRDELISAQMVNFLIAGKSATPRYSTSWLTRRPRNNLWDAIICGHAAAEESSHLSQSAEGSR